MLSTICKDTLPTTLCEQTLAVLKEQEETKLYTKTIDVFWSPDVSLEEMKEKMKLFGHVEVRDHRIRPSSHINPSTNLPYTPKEIKENEDACQRRIDELREVIKTKTTTDTVWRDSHYESKSECEKRSKFQNLPARMRTWKPLRQVDASLLLNHHKKVQYQEIANKYPQDVFVQQIWSCIHQRCSLMDEANKGRKNPMRNIHIQLTVTPAETYFCASWDIHRSEYRNEYESGYITYLTNMTEYRLNPDGQVVQFKSEVTMNIEQKQKEEKDKIAERKRLEEEAKQKKKEEELAGTTHHTDQWGHPYSQKEKKKNTAVYDNIWRLEPTSSEMRKDWEDRVPVVLMQSRARGDIFLGKRVVDTPSHSIFTLFGFTYHYLVLNEVSRAITTVEGIDYFPQPLTVQINKGRTGKYVEDNKTKQLRVVEKVDLKDFPKA